MGLGLRGKGSEVLPHLNRVSSAIRFFVLLTVLWIGEGLPADAQDFRFNTIQIEGMPPAGSDRPHGDAGAPDDQSKGNWWKLFK